MKQKQAKNCVIAVVIILAVALAGQGCTDITSPSLPDNTKLKELMMERENNSDVDRISLPPLKAEFFSPKRDFIFTVSTEDNWKSKQAEGKLIQFKPGHSNVVWKKKLPQEYGPRYTLVGQQGEILMLDEWINVKSNYAIMLINTRHNLLIQYNFEQVQQVLNIPIAQIVQKATGGSWWISAPPRLDKSASIAYVSTAGKILHIDLHTGKLY